MRLTVRIYKRHDPDLFAFYYSVPSNPKENEFDIKNEIKDVLKLYISGKNMKVRELPALECQPMASLPPKVNFHIPLDSKKDKDIIEWLKTIKMGRRNNLIKNIFRSAYPTIISAYYDDSEGTSFFLNERR